MRAHPLGQPVMHRADLQIDCNERPFDQGEGFVAAHGCCVVEGGSRQTGAHDVDAVGGRLGSDFTGLAGEADRLGEVKSKCLPPCAY
jgi:hypothetical protein